MILLQNINNQKYNLLDNSDSISINQNELEEEYIDETDNDDNDSNKEVIINLNGIDKRFDKFGIELDEKNNRYYFKFGFQAISPSTTTTPTYDYTFSEYLPNELNGVISESEYQLACQYIKIHYTRNGSPQIDYFYFSLVYLFYFFTPFIIYIYQDQDQNSNVYFYYLLFGCLVLVSLFFIYYVPFYKKTQRMYLEIVNLLNRKSITFEKIYFRKTTKYQLFQFINLSTHLIVSISGILLSTFSNKNQNQFINTIYKIFIIIDIPVICYYLYNYILFTEFRNIIPISKLLNENDYIKMLNNNIYKANGPFPYYISYNSKININNNSNSNLMSLSVSSNIDNNTDSNDVN